VAQNAVPQLRVTWAARGMAGLFVLAAFSQLKLQTYERDNTLKLADATGRFTRERKDFARRGAILTADGKPIAEDEDAYQLQIQFKKVPKSEAFFMDLGQASGIPASEFESLAHDEVGQRTWRQPMSALQSEAIAKVKKTWRADGLSLARIDHRSYPFGDDASCVVGLLREGKAQFGLEASQNAVLTGEDGLRKGLTDKQGQFLPMRMASNSKGRKDGSNITLTIDSDLQMVAAREVQKAVVANQADNGIAIVMNPANGDILAMANWPSFAPYQTDGTDGDLSDPQAGYNPNYMAQLEPGSTFKILTLAKALDTGHATMSEIINCPGEFKPSKRTKPIHCDSHHGNRAHGAINAEMAIEKSCNVIAATWATRVGYTDFVDYIRDLGLLSRSNLGLPHEAHGNFNYQEPNHPLQLATLGFGQSLTCTPATLLGAFSMIANKGVRVEPRLIKAVGERETPIDPGKRIIREETADEVMKCMELVIQGSHGTGRTLRIPGYELAGKTGTAQKVGKGEAGYVSNFVGFVPANQPRAAILVMVNHPKGARYYGAEVAGPVFQELARAVIRRYNLPATGSTIAPVDSHTAGAVAIR